MQFLESASRISQKLELALCFGIKDTDDPEEASLREQARLNGCIDYQGHPADRANLEARGWRIRSASHIAGSPEDYRRHIRASRGEFSCVELSCMKFQNAWVSDRSVCYLASGKLVIVWNTGLRAYLPDAEGMCRFTHDR